MLQSRLQCDDEPTVQCVVYTDSRYCTLNCWNEHNKLLTQTQGEAKVVRRATKMQAACFIAQKNSTACLAFESSDIDFQS
jgi:hypothetical protein